MAKTIVAMSVLILYNYLQGIPEKANPNAPSKRSTFGFALFGAPSGTRTQDPLIKSQLLYQLS